MDNARWYDPALGRFAQADTLIPQSQGVQAWDRYAYVNNNPIGYMDSSGHCLEDLCIGETIIFGAILVDALTVLMGTGLIAYNVSNPPYLESV